MRIIKNLSREEKVLLYCINALDELVLKGIITKGNYTLPKESRFVINRLIKEGFQPTDEEIKNTLYFLTNMDNDETNSL